LLTLSLDYATISFPTPSWSFIALLIAAGFSFNNRNYAKFFVQKTTTKFYQKSADKIK
jgi:hypothetical protein